MTNRPPQSPGTSTFHERTRIDDDRGGRFASLSKPQVIGTDPSASYPRLPFNPFENDQQSEPTIDASFCGQHGSISFIRDAYLRSEVIRILISTSVALRIWFDENDPEAFEGLNTNCGRLWTEWKAKTKAKSEVLTLREACNKIIHATKVHHDGEFEKPRSGNPDEEERYLHPFLYLYGRKGRQDWRAKLSIVDFVRWGAAAFRTAGWGQ